MLFLLLSHVRLLAILVLCLLVCVGSEDSLSLDNCHSCCSGVTTSSSLALVLSMLDFWVYLGLCLLRIGSSFAIMDISLFVLAF